MALVFVIALATTAYSQTPDPQTALTQAVAELQKNPADPVLRVKTIGFAPEMKPAPTVSL